VGHGTVQNIEEVAQGTAAAGCLLRQFRHQQRLFLAENLDQELRRSPESAHRCFPRMTQAGGSSDVPGVNESRDSELRVRSAASHLLPGLTLCVFAFWAAQIESVQ